MAKIIVLVGTGSTGTVTARGIAAVLDAARAPFVHLVVNEVTSDMPGMPSASAGNLDSGLEGSSWSAERTQDHPDLPAPTIPLAAVVEAWPLHTWTVPGAYEAARHTLTAAGYPVVGGYEVGEEVQVDYARWWRDGETSPGPKIFWLARRQPALTREQFADRWRAHTYYTRRYQPGVWRYVQNVVEATFDGADATVDGIASTHHRDADDFLHRSVDSEEGARAVADDVVGFTIGSEAYVTREVIVRSATPVPC